MTAKSEKPASNDSMLRVARRSSVRYAFISTSHRCVPETSAAFLLVPLVPLVALVALVLLVPLVAALFISLIP
jgi:hypothetical protein